MSDIAERLRYEYSQIQFPHKSWMVLLEAADRIAELEAINDTYRIVDKKRFKRLTELEAKLDALREQLETKDLQLAACMTVAGANTRESAKKVRDMHPDYRCAAVEDVERAVDREMDYREQLDEVRGLVDQHHCEAEWCGKSFHNGEAGLCFYCKTEQALQGEDK